MMEPNEVISKWRGECPLAPENGVTYCSTKCPLKKEFAEIHNCELKFTNYEHDPAAWTPELFDRIEEAGLKKSFINNLYMSSPRESGRAASDIIWVCMSSTPAQKAEALSRSIMECDEKGDRG
jgi:hypothetical protein